MRSAVSAACATAGVVLVVIAGVAPDSVYAVPALFGGLAFLLVSHALTPCIDRIAVWRKHLLK